MLVFEESGVKESQDDDKSMNFLCVYISLFFCYVKGVNDMISFDS